MAFRPKNTAVEKYKPGTWPRDSDVTRVDSSDLKTKFEYGQGRLKKTSLALYKTLINIYVRSS